MRAHSRIYVRPDAGELADPRIVDLAVPCGIAEIPEFGIAQPAVLVDLIVIAEPAVLNFNHVLKLQMLFPVFQLEPPLCEKPPQPVCKRR